MKIRFVWNIKQVDNHTIEIATIPGAVLDQHYINQVLEQLGNEKGGRALGEATDKVQDTVIRAGMEVIH